MLSGDKLGDRRVQQQFDVIAWRAISVLIDCCITVFFNWYGRVLDKFHVCCRGLYLVSMYLFTWIYLSVMSSCW